MPVPYPVIDWSQAPRWALYAAMDASIRWEGAKWYWFSHRPEPDHKHKIWRAPEKGGRMAVMEPNAAEAPDWTKTLQERPNHA